MTSRNNERLQARRQALREQHKQELEEARRRQAAQLASVTAFDSRMAKLEDARRDVAEAVAEAVAVFGGRRDAAAALGLTPAETRDYLNAWNEHAASSDTEAETEETAAAPGTTAEGKDAEGADTRSAAAHADGSSTIPAARPAEPTYEEETADGLTGADSPASAR